MKKGANNTYFGNIRESVTSLYQGIKLTLQHALDARNSHKPIGVEDETYFEQETGIVTLRYPYESIPVPDNGRYRLHNEIDDCIVCDKCAKICPVNCIEIEAIKSPEEVGKTSDGSSIRLFPAKFDIDMAKCCYCGLCTTVCPTECLTMTKVYDFSEYSVEAMNYHFTNLTPAESAQKQQEYDLFQLAKQKAKAATVPPAAPVSNAEKPAEENVAKKPFKPVIKKKETSAETTTETGNTIADTPTSNNEPPAVKKPFKPIIKKKEATPVAETQIDAQADTNVAIVATDEHNESTAEDKPTAQHATASTVEGPNKPQSTAKKPVFKPVIKQKPVTENTTKPAHEPSDAPSSPEKPPVVGANEPIVSDKAENKTTETAGKAQENKTLDEPEPTVPQSTVRKQPLRPIIRKKE